MENFVIISGCSSGGKSTLLTELRRRGFATIDEPGRRIVAEELIRNGRALPWMDAVAFARRAIEMSLADLSAAEAERAADCRSPKGWPPGPHFEATRFGRPTGDADSLQT